MLWKKCNEGIVSNNSSRKNESLPTSPQNRPCLRRGYSEFLKKSVNSLVGILKQYPYYFIDSKGVPFIYQKTVMLQLKYRKIRKIERKTTASLIWIDNWKFPFTIPRPPAPEMLWAGLLFMKGLPWIIYEYSETDKKSTRRIE